MRKQQPDGAVIALLMRRFIYTAGITGLMQVATLILDVPIVIAFTVARYSSPPYPAT